MFTKTLLIKFSFCSSHHDLGPFVRWRDYTPGGTRNLGRNKRGSLIFQPFLKFPGRIILERPGGKEAYFIIFAASDLILETWWVLYSRCRFHWGASDKKETPPEGDSQVKIRSQTSSHLQYPWFQILSNWPRLSQAYPPHTPLLTPSSWNGATVKVHGLKQEGYHLVTSI